MNEQAKLTLGPVLFHWPAERMQDFYARIADEADIDIVYLGESVCSKRASFFDPLLPDLIVMDLNLPGLNGWEATRQLKSQPATSHIPIIVLTAHTSGKSRDEAFAAGCDDYDTKPIDFSGLVKKIESLLHRGDQAAPSDKH